MGLDAGTGSLISGGSSLLGGLFGKNAASNAASVQAKAAQQAAQLQAQMFGYTASKLEPFVAGGTQNLLNPYYGGTSMLPQWSNEFLQPLTNKLGAIANPGQYTTAASMPPVNVSTNPFTTNPVTTAQGVANWGLGADQQAALAQTPGYQFTRNQGLNAVQNSAATSGRGVSGNALGGAANFATGLANNTFNQQYQNMLAGQQQAFGQGLASNDQLLRSQGQNFSQQLGVGNYNLQAQQQGWQQALGSAQLAAALEGQQFGQQHNNLYDPLQAMLQGLGLSENAAAMVGNQAITAGNNIGNYLTQGANATASGIIGGANALSGGFGGFGNSLSNYMLFNQLFGGGNSGGGSFNYPGASADFADLTGI